MKDFLTFRRMLAPMLIQAIFWLIIASLMVIAILDIIHHAPFRVLFTIVVIAPLVTRIVCEMFILLFRINDNLTEIRQTLKQEIRGHQTPP